MHIYFLLPAIVAAVTLSGCVGLYEEVSIPPQSTSSPQYQYQATISDEIGDQIAALPSADPNDPFKGFVYVPPPKKLKHASEALIGAACEGRARGDMGDAASFKIYNIGKSREDAWAHLTISTQWVYGPPVTGTYTRGHFDGNKIVFPEDRPVRGSKNILNLRIMEDGSTVVGGWSNGERLRADSGTFTARCAPTQIAQNPSR